MIIEINAVPEVEEVLLNMIKEKLVKLSHIKKDISRAEVYLRVDDSDDINNKVCEIRLSIFSDDLFTHRRAANFSKATNEAIESISKIIEDKKKDGKEPPDEILSTLKV